MSESKKDKSDVSVLLCANCDGCGIVCEDHTNLPWDGVSDSKRACDCGGAGVVCPKCGNGT